MILAYLAGPFTADTPWGVEANIRQAELAAEEILQARDDVALLVPHSIGRHFVGRVGTPEYWYTATMRMLEACDAVVMLPGWQSSKGARNELSRALELGRDIWAGPGGFADKWPPDLNTFMHRALARAKGVQL
jgi:Domain of unknown function (DUF4406)